MAQASKGDTVRLHYTGRLSNGTVFDTTSDSDPLQFTIGQGEVIDGVDQAVIGMEEGQQKTVTVTPEQGFGEHNAALKQTISRNELPGEIKVGDRLRAVQGDREIQVWVSELRDDEAVVDANHPLAGQTLTFELELVSIGEGG